MSTPILKKTFPKLVIKIEKIYYLVAFNVIFLFFINSIEISQLINKIIFPSYLHISQRQRQKWLMLVQWIEYYFMILSLFCRMVDKDADGNLIPEHGKTWDFNMVYVPLYPICKILLFKRWLTLKRSSRWRFKHLSLLEIPHSWIV